MQTKTKKVVIDGSCIKSTKFNGAQRYALEILRELDKLVPRGKYELLIRREYKDLLCLCNIKKVEIEAKNKLIWGVKVLFYLVKNNALYIHFTNGFTLWRKSIITLHDIYAFYGMYNNTWLYNIKAKCKVIIDAIVAMHIVTVSEFSKQTMLDKLPLKPEKISVIYNGWQHLENIESDEQILERENLHAQSYYFFLGRLVNNKNIKWIYNVADRNPNDYFVIAGALYNEKFDFYMGKNQNIVYTGFINDGEMKALYQKCKAFLFPSLMEGFGIPPMEALYNGAPIIISNTSSLPEIYEDSAHYIDPMKYDYCLDDLLNEPVASPEKILSKYSWEKSAKQWYELIEGYTN
ncbi:MAG: glycosyltransferase family 4 protein [Lachnospiraceae bacterium]|nr:glycosyltransferase family 4 protein [Lachnospiraceae bacterium]